MPDFKVARRGTDSSGRGIYASEYMWNWWLGVVAELGFTPVITQGAWMVKNGGGAVDSAGYHDGGGCFDLRVWNLTDAQVRRTIHVIRHRGAAAWLRNLAHGGFTDPHIHLVLGTDADLDDGAAEQWREYIAGGDGMGGADYHPRPHPLVTKPPEDDMPFTEQELRAIVRDEIDAALKAELKNGETFRATINQSLVTTRKALETAEASRAALGVIGKKLDAINKHLDKLGVKPVED